MIQPSRTVAQYQGVSQASVCRALKSAHFFLYNITLTKSCILMMKLADRDIVDGSLM